jgi:hypothetical protein
MHRYFRVWQVSFPIEQLDKYHNLMAARPLIFLLTQCVGTL